MAIEIQIPADDLQPDATLWRSICNRPFSESEWRAICQQIVAGGRVPHNLPLLLKKAQEIFGDSLKFRDPCKFGPGKNMLDFFEGYGAKTYADLLNFEEHARQFDDLITEINETLLAADGVIQFAYIYVNHLLQRNSREELILNSIIKLYFIQIEIELANCKIAFFLLPKITPSEEDWKKIFLYLNITLKIIAECRDFIDKNTEKLSCITEVNSHLEEYEYFCFKLKLDVILNFYDSHPDYLESEEYINEFFFLYRDYKNSVNNLFPANANEIMQKEDSRILSYIKIQKHREVIQNMIIACAIECESGRFIHVIPASQIDLNYLKSLIAESMSGAEYIRLQMFFGMETERLLRGNVTNFAKRDLEHIGYFFCDISMTDSSQIDLVKKYWNEGLVNFLLKNEIADGEQNIFFVLLIINLYFMATTIFSFNEDSDRPKLEYFTSLFDSFNGRIKEIISVPHCPPDIDIRNNIIVNAVRTFRESVSVYKRKLEARMLTKLLSNANEYPVVVSSEKPKHKAIFKTTAQDREKLLEARLEEEKRDLSEEIKSVANAGRQVCDGYAEVKGKYTKADLQRLNAEIIKINNAKQLLEKRGSKFQDIIVSGLFNYNLILVNLIYCYAQVLCKIKHDSTGNRSKLDPLIRAASYEDHNEIFFQAMEFLKFRLTESLLASEDSYSKSTDVVRKSIDILLLQSINSAGKVTRLHEFLFMFVAFRKSGREVSRMAADVSTEVLQSIFLKRDRFEGKFFTTFLKEIVERVDVPPELKKLANAKITALNQAKAAKNALSNSEKKKNKQSLLFVILIKSIKKENPISLWLFRILYRM